MMKDLDGDDSELRVASLKAFGSNLPPTVIRDLLVIIEQDILNSNKTPSTFNSLSNFGNNRSNKKTSNNSIRGIFIVDFVKSCMEHNNGLVRKSIIEMLLILLLKNKLILKV